MTDKKESKTPKKSKTSKAAETKKQSAKEVATKGVEVKKGGLKVKTIHKMEDK